jgi:hypothetical protein
LADVFYLDRAALKAASPDNGDVAYVTGTGEVFDIVTSKLKIPSTTFIKCTGSIWAIYNQEKSASYSLVKPGTFDTTKDIEAGTIVIKDSILYVANAKVAKNTAFATGTSGATFQKLLSSTTFTRTPAQNGVNNASGKRFWTDKNSKIETAGSIKTIKFSNWGVNTMVAVIRPNASTEASAFAVSAVWQVKKAWLVPNGATSFDTGGYPVAIGDYVAVWSGSGAGTKVLNSIGLAGYGMCTGEYSTVTDGMSITVAALMSNAIGGIGWEIII